MFLGDFKYPGSLQLLAKNVNKETRMKIKFTANHDGLEDTIILLVGKYGLPGNTKRYNRNSLISISDMKKIGVVGDFLINFRGVFIMKHEQTLGSLSIDLNSYCNEGTVIDSTSSTGFLPDLSLESLDAPLISRALTGRVLLNVSTLLIAKCNGVNPSISCSSKYFTQLKR
jgi:hypothetical protein